MSAKKVKALRRVTTFNSAEDKYEIRFYNGRKRATDKEVKNEIKANYKKLDPDQLSAKDRQYLGRVIGGHKRQAEKPVRIDGKFVAKAFFDQPDNPIKWNELAQARGYKSPNELWENDPKLYKVAKDAYYSEKGLEFQYTSDTILNYIDSFGGKIFINGIAMTKIKAIVFVDNIDKAIKRKFGSFYNNYDVNYTHGYTELHISTPTKENIKEAEEPEDLEEFGTEVVRSGDGFSDEDTLEMQERLWAKNLVDGGKGAGSYEYKVTTKEKIKGKKAKYRNKTETITARSVIDAKVITKNTTDKKNIILKIERIYKKDKPKKKK